VAADEMSRDEAVRVLDAVERDCGDIHGWSERVIAAFKMARTALRQPVSSADELVRAKARWADAYERAHGGHLTSENYDAACEELIAAGEAWADLEDARKLALSALEAQGKP
jgi:hypothetical protein